MIIFVFWFENHLFVKDPIDLICYGPDNNGLAQSVQQAITRTNADWVN